MDKESKCSEREARFSPADGFFLTFLAAWISVGLPYWDYQHKNTGPSIIMNPQIAYIFISLIIAALGYSVLVGQVRKAFENGLSKESFLICVAVALLTVIFFYLRSKSSFFPSYALKVTYWIFILWSAYFILELLELIFEIDLKISRKRRGSYESEQKVGA